MLLIKFDSHLFYKSLDFVTTLTSIKLYKDIGNIFSSEVNCGDKNVKHKYM